MEGVEKTICRVDSVPSISAYYPVTGWGVVVEKHLDVVFAPIRKINVWVFGITGFMLLIGGFFAYQWAEVRASSKRSEVALEKANEELQTMNEEFQTMNEELQNQQKELSEANARLAEVSSAKSDFLANMSYELRTPLNAVIGFSEILEDRLFGDLNEKQMEYVKDIASSGEHLLNLINDILDLSKVESGKMGLDLDRFQIRNVLNASMTMLKEKAMKHGIKLGLEIEPAADTEIEADERKLKQVLFNLLSNAVKFTPEGGSVRVQARFVQSSKFEVQGYEEKNLEHGTLNVERNGNFMEISVSDTGIGIKAEDLPRLFKDVAQFESPYTKKYGGTGVGLMLTKKLVELQGGRIWVESELGKGSTFRFVVPCEVKQPSGPIVDPVTKFLAWEHCLKHISRVLSFHKRKGRQFGLLRIELSAVAGSEEHMSVIKILKGLARHHEILSKSKDGYYYLITFEADKKVVEATAMRITAALKENGHDPIIKNAIYMEDGENINELLETLNN